MMNRWLLMLSDTLSAVGIYPVTMTGLGTVSAVDLLFGIFMK